MRKRHVLDLVAAELGTDNASEKFLELNFTLVELHAEPQSLRVPNEPNEESSMLRITTLLCVTTLAVTLGLASPATAADTGPGSYYNSGGYGGFGTSGNNRNYRSGGYAPINRNRVYSAVQNPRFDNYSGDGGFYRDRNNRGSRGLNTVPHNRNSHEPRTRYFVHGSNMAY